MTTWELIREMVQKGYELRVGPHTGWPKSLRGYFAIFFKDNESKPKYEECDECDGRDKCDECPGPSWNDCGHAMTPHRAIVMAARRALGVEVAVPTTEEFIL